MTRFVSTRGGAPPVSFREAVVRGLAPDGGLYVPESMPRPAIPSPASSIAEVAEAVLEPFLDDGPLAAELPAMIEETFTFPIPLEAHGGHRVLELYHGPTGAFKDVGARFMAACLARVEGGETERPRTVLVATSGDTGSAVAAAFHGRPGARVAVLFPADGVSPRQRHLLTCFGGNVRSFAVRGSFDDAQRVVKGALAEPELADRHRLTTANSINLARLLPQVVYHAWAALRSAPTGLHPSDGAPGQDRSPVGRPPGSSSRAGEGERGPTAAHPFVVPTGNAGNVLAALYAREMGFPLGPVVAATNANRAIADFVGGAPWRPRPSRATIANAMDVGDPSNLERIRHLFGSDDALRRGLLAVSVTDDEIRETIRRVAAEGRIVDPHTAVGFRAVEALGIPNAVVVATAHAAKFPEIVEPLAGGTVEPPPALAALLARDTHEEALEPTVDALQAALDHA